MLRWLVVLLLLANLGYWAWSEGRLGALGEASSSQRDPARAALQVRPDSVRVLRPGAASAASGAARVGAAEGAGVCLEAGPLAPASLAAAERVLSDALPEGGWVLERRDVAAQYAVVLGPLNPAQARQKQQELARLRLAFEELSLPPPPGQAASAPGHAAPALALGRYDSRDEAEAALGGFKQRGAHTARVALLREAGSPTWLRVAEASPSLVTRLRALSVAALGSGFVPCPTVPPQASP